MVMEDITRRGGDPRAATRPLTVAQAADGVRGLARLHGRYWGERLARQHTLDRPAPFAAWQGMAAGIEIGLRRAGDMLPPEVARLGADEVEGTSGPAMSPRWPGARPRCCTAIPTSATPTSCPANGSASSTGRSTGAAITASTSATSSRAR